MCASVANADGQLGRPSDMLVIRSRDLSSQCMWSTRKATVHAGHLCTWHQHSVYVVNLEGHSTCWSSVHVTSTLSVHGQLGRPQYMLVIFACDISSQSTWSTRKTTVHAGHLCTWHQQSVYMVNSEGHSTWWSMLYMLYSRLLTAFSDDCCMLCICVFVSVCCGYTICNPNPGLGIIWYHRAL